MQRLSSLLIGFGLGIFGMSLLYDPWGQVNIIYKCRNDLKGQ